MKIFKILGSLIITIILLLIIGVVLLMTLVSPNAFKGEISQYVHAKTGRELTIHGDISWSFFPWVGFKVKDVYLSNAPNFGKLSFASIKEADVRVKVEPLFSGKVEMGNITLKALHLNLMKNADGKNNWDSLIADTEHESDETTAPGDDKPITIRISNIDVTNSSINWDDKQSGHQFELNNVEIHSQKISLGKAFPMNIKFTIKGEQPKIHASVSLSSDVTLDLKQEKYDFHSLNATLKLLNQKILAATITTLSGDIALDLKRETLSIVGLTLNNNGLQINVDINGSKILRTPLFQGQLQLFPLNLKKYLKAYGATIKTHNQTALTKIALTAEFQASPKYLKLNNIKATVDNTKLTGRFDFADFKRHTIGFNLHADRLNLDNYMLTAQKSNTRKKTKANRSSPKQQATSDLSFLRKANINGNLLIDKFSANDVDLTKINVTLNTANGIIRIDPFRANLYRGTTHGKITIDIRDSAPRYAINETISNVELRALFGDLANNNKISGRANVNMNLTMRGNNTNTLLKTLNGTARMQVNNGVYYGQNIDYQLMRAYAFVKRKSSQPAQQTKQTRFQTLSVSATIRSGVANTQDLLMRTQKIQVSGNGTANLINHQLNFYLSARGIGEQKTIIGLPFLESGITRIPLRLTGTFENPKLLPNFSALGKMIIQETVAGKVKEIVGGGLPKHIEKGKDITKDIVEKIKQQFKVDKLFGN